MLAGEHRVQAGETLYSIAWFEGLDVQQLARMNHLKAPFHLNPGQTIALKDRGPTPEALNPIESAPSFTGVTLATAGAAVATQPSSVANNESLPEPTYKTLATSTRSANGKALGSIKGLQWPLKGKLISRFGQGHKGIELGQSLGTPVKAAAAGEVVYSGDGLRGYGNLVIIKHNEEFLSAYGHNRLLKVQEGDVVKVGQTIAEVGERNQVPLLHFEIRYKGKPVDPLLYLPKS